LAAAALWWVRRCAILAILYTAAKTCCPHCKLLLGLVLPAGTVIVFSDIPADVPAATMVAACYQNGVNAWLSGGALGAVLGGKLLLLWRRPAANLVMAALALCASLYIFDITPAEVWQWLCNVGGGVHEKGVAVYEQNAARRAERRAERLAAEAEEESYEEEDPDELDEDFEDDEETGLQGSRLAVRCALRGASNGNQRAWEGTEGRTDPGTRPDGPPTDGR